MARQRTDSFWVERVRSLVANEPGVTLAAMARRVEEEGKRRGRDDYPAERTIRRIRDDYHKLAPAEQAGYREVYWPESFERGDLPWEAAPAVLELLRDWRARHFREGDPDRRPPRPETRHALWFWRVTLANAGLSVDDRSMLALQSMVAGHQGGDSRDTLYRMAELTIMYGGEYLAAPGELPGLDKLTTAMVRAKLEDHKEGNAHAPEASRS